MSEHDLLKSVSIALAESEITQSEESGVNLRKVRGGIKSVKLNTLDAAYQRCQERYGEAPFRHVIKRVLSEHIFRQGNNLCIESYRVQDAGNNISQLLRETRLGHSQVLGGYRANMDPVVMISVEQLIDLVGDAMTHNSMADLLPASRPPITEALALSEGVSASTDAVEL